MNILSCVQFMPRLARCPADVSDNVRRAGRLIVEAGRLGSQLIVFPELAFTGYSFLGRDQAAAVSEPMDGMTFRAMRVAAVELKAHVVWGYVEAGDDGRLYNSCSMVGPDGSLLTSYRKINLWGNDFLWATPGYEPAPIVNTEIGRASVVICRDLRDKVPGNIPRTAAKDPPLWRGKKVDVVAACLNWGKGGFPSTTWMDFAADNDCTVAVANRWGVEENDTFRQNFGQGGSCVIRPDWSVHTGGLKFNQDCVVTASF